MPSPPVRSSPMCMTPPLVSQLLVQVGQVCSSWTFPPRCIVFEVPSLMSAKSFERTPQNTCHCSPARYAESSAAQLTGSTWAFWIGVVPTLRPGVVRERDVMGLAGIL